MDRTTILLIVILIEVIVMGFLPWAIFLIVRKSKKWKRKRKSSDLSEKKISIIQNINTSFDNLIASNKGATIIIDDSNGIYDIIADHEFIDSEVSSNLITSIFQATGSPLHDGAIIISNGRIKSASAYISKLSQKRVSSVFGTRHRSALGASEVTNALIITLSEETKTVHIFSKGKYEKINQKDFFDKLYNYWKD